MVNLLESLAAVVVVLGHLLKTAAILVAAVGQTVLVNAASAAAVFFGLDEGFSDGLCRRRRLLQKPVADRFGVGTKARFVERA